MRDIMDKVLFIGAGRRRIKVHTTLGYRQTGSYLMIALAVSICAL